MKKVFLDNLPKWGNGRYKGKIKWKESIGKKVKFVYNDLEGEFNIISIKNSDVITIEYNNIIEEIKKRSLYECKLGRIIHPEKWEYKYNIGDRLVNEYHDFTIIDKKRIEVSKGNNVKHYKYKCNKCGWECNDYYQNGEFNKEFWINEYELQKIRWCKCCGDISNILVKGINSLYYTDNWIVDYVGEEFAKNNNKSTSKKVNYKCSDCGHEGEVNLRYFVDSHSLSCPICSDGIRYPNKFMANLLKQLNITFESEKTFEWCKYKINNKNKKGIYDFYIPSKNLIIEMDGGWHFEENNMNDKQSLEESKEIDYIKDKLAKEHDIKVIRINCYYKSNNRFEYIKNNVVKSEISNIYNLNNIDWNKIDDNSIHSNVVKAGKIKKENPELSTVEIAKMFDVYYTTIIDWLKTCDKLGICTYDVDQEKKNGTKRTSITNRKNCSKPLICLENKMVFYNVHDIPRICKDIFGIDKMSIGNISMVCKGQRNHHHNLHFKYIEDLSNEEKELYDVNKQLDFLENVKEEIDLKTYLNLRDKIIN